MTDAVNDLLAQLKMARRNLSYFTPFGVKNGIDATIARYDVRCPYCKENRVRQECIDAGQAIGVLRPCAVGPRDDAPEAEKRQFKAWIGQR